MLDCTYNTDCWGSNRENFVRLKSPSSDSSNSFKMSMRKGSQGLLSIGKTLRRGVTRAVFPEDLNVSEKKILDPQDKFLRLWNKVQVIACIFSLSVDPLFLYLPIVNPQGTCLTIDPNLANAVTTLRTIVDVFYLLHMALQFRIAYIAPSSRVFGRGELVIDAAKIAKRYFCSYFIVDFLAVFPLPQIAVWSYMAGLEGRDVLATKKALLGIILLQYVPRFIRIIPLTSELKRTTGLFAETAWAGALYYFLYYMLASHIFGAFWYLLTVDRQEACWQEACAMNTTCKTRFLYCNPKLKIMPGFDEWNKNSSSVLSEHCTVEGDNPPFDFGISTQAIKYDILASTNFIIKYIYCLWWGLQNLSTLGQGLIASIYYAEVIFSISVCVVGLLLIALLLSNMQTYLQSLTTRLEEMRVKRRDSEQWMHHRFLPSEIKDRVRRYDEYKWLETRGVDEESLVSALPKDLRRDIKRHLCLALVRRVPLFENMDERLLDAICERLRPSLHTERSFIVREGDPVVEMLFIIRGRLVSETTDGGRSGFLNRSNLAEGDFCGEELLTWALDPKSGSNLPSSTRTVKAVTEVEGFALEAEQVKFVASQFRRLHSRQLQHTFRFYSEQWRTWAARFIQAAYRRHLKRKMMEQMRREEEEEEAEAAVNGRGGGSRGPYSLRATFLASRFAANAIRGIQRHRLSRGLTDLMPAKPPEPDFTADEAD